MMSKTLRATPAIVAFCCFAAVASAGQVTVGSGASFDLGTGSLDLGCADLTVGGTLSAGTVGMAAARDVTIDPTGLVNGETALLQVAGDWDNAGTFNAGSSSVNLVDGCGLLSATIGGNSTFATLAMTTASGKLFQFEAGSTQTVTQSLSIQGADGDLLEIRSTLDGSEAFLDSQGTQSVAYVDVKDNHAVGDQIPLMLSSLISGNALGWILAVPALPASGLALLALALGWAGRRTLVARRRAGAVTLGT